MREGDRLPRGGGGQSVGRTGRRHAGPLQKCPPGYPPDVRCLHRAGLLRWGPSLVQAALSLFAHQGGGWLPQAGRPGWGRPQGLGGTWAWRLRQQDARLYDRSEVQVGLPHVGSSPPLKPLAPTCHAQHRTKELRSRRQTDDPEMNTQGCGAGHLPQERFSETPTWPQISPWSSDLEPHSLCPQSLSQPPPSDLARCHVTSAPSHPAHGSQSSLEMPAPPPALVTASRRPSCAGTFEQSESIALAPGAVTCTGPKRSHSHSCSSTDRQLRCRVQTRETQSSELPCRLGWHSTGGQRPSPCRVCDSFDYRRKNRKAAREAQAVRGLLKRAGHNVASSRDEDRDPGTPRGPR